MSESSEDEPTQETEQGYTIPVPKRRDVMAVLRKAAKGRGGAPPEDEAPRPR